MDTGLTTIPEAAIEKHRATAQSFITRIVVLEDPSRESGTALAGTNRRFVSTVSVGSVRRTREVELAKTVGAVHPDDQLLTIPQHTLLFRARRGTAIALAISDSLPKAPTSKACRPGIPARRSKATKRPPSRSFCRPRLTSPPSASPPTCSS